MNYTEVIAAALSYSDRTDPETAAAMDTFLRIVESRVNKVIKTQKMTARTAIATVQDQNYYGLPADFAGVRDIQINDIDGNVTDTAYFLTPEKMNNLSVNSEIPKIFKRVYYSIVDDQLHIKPAQDNNEIEIIYYRRLPELNTVNNLNWLSDINPDTYVFGLVTEISVFAKDYESGEIWNSRFEKSLDDIAKDDKDSRWSGTPMVVSVDG